MEKRETSIIKEIRGNSYKIEKFPAELGAYIAIITTSIGYSLFSGNGEIALGSLQKQMGKEEFFEFAKDVLSVVSIKKEAGFFPVYDELGNLRIELQNDSVVYMCLLIHSLRFNLKNFTENDGQKCMGEAMAGAMEGLSFFPALG